MSTLVQTPPLRSRGAAGPIFRSSAARSARRRAAGLFRQRGHAPSGRGRSSSRWSTFYEKQYANVHRGIHWLSDQSGPNCSRRPGEKVQALHQCAAAARRCIFTYGTTEGINLVARSWGDANIRPATKSC